ncbi:MAG: GHKL domain-containing protein [Clostridia bacterium]|nr:GHKL domain-containing protein [Clostridia bacterium]
MQAVAAWIGSSFGVFWALSFLDNLLLIIFCVLATLTVFHLPVRFRLWKALPVAAVCAVIATLSAMQALRGLGGTRALSTVQVIYPFFCTMLFFPRRDFWKSCIVVFGSNLLDVLKYLVLILFFNYDFQTSAPALDLLVDVLLYAAAVIVIAGVFLAYARRKNSALLVARINVPLYLLIVLTLIVFMTTILLLGINHSGARPIELAVVLLNIPLFTGTAIYSAVVLLRTKVSEENYKAMVDMQIRHYAQMEAKNEELRIFRHDFPKQIRPLAACLHEGRIGEAEEMLRHFDQSIEYARPRFATGNTMLDTVLECAQQTAEQDGVSIVWQPGSVFPAQGIAPEDIYTIFPNALDNAVEACRKTGRPCEVSVSSHVTGGTVYVRIQNPFEGRAVIRGDRVETTKADKSRHGFGTQSIKKAAAKYGSDNVRFSQNDGIFAVDMELRMQPASGQ